LAVDAQNLALFGLGAFSGVEAVFDGWSDDRHVAFCLHCSLFHVFVV